MTVIYYLGRSLECSSMNKWSKEPNVAPTCLPGVLNITQLAASFYWRIFMSCDTWIVLEAIYGDEK